MISVAFTFPKLATLNLSVKPGSSMCVVIQVSVSYEVRTKTEREKTQI